MHCKVPKAQRNRCFASVLRSIGSFGPGNRVFFVTDVVAHAPDASASDPDLQPACRMENRRLRSIRSRRHAPTAPGTTVMQLRLANARRSMFCEVMYSSACQRVTMFMRLPTFALPAMAPISGS